MYGMYVNMHATLPICFLISPLRFTMYILPCVYTYVSPAYDPFHIVYTLAAYYICLYLSKINRYPTPINIYRYVLYLFYFISHNFNRGVTGVADSSSLLSLGLY
jgi:hypothetical protein